jgi:ribosome-associated protein
MDPEDDNDEALRRPTKSQLKRETQVLRDLVMRLMKLPPDKLAGISVNETIRDAVAQARKMQRGALARQLRHITGLMRAVDTQAVTRELDALAQPHRQAVRSFQEVERWRDALLSGDTAVEDELVTRRAADRQQLRQLVRNALKERELNKPPRWARLLFKYLMALQANS